MRTSNIIFGFLIILVCAAGWLHTSTWANVQATGLPEDFYPKFLFGLTGLCGLGLILKEFSASRATSAIPPFSWLALCIFVVLMLMYSFTLEYLGFMIPSAFFLFGAMMCMGERRWKILFPVSIGTSVFIFYLFTMAFQIPLPELAL